MHQTLPNLAKRCVFAQQAAGHEVHGATSHPVEEGGAPSAVTSSYVVSQRHHLQTIVLAPVGPLNRQSWLYLNAALQITHASTRVSIGHGRHFE